MSNPLEVPVLKNTRPVVRCIYQLKAQLELNGAASSDVFSRAIGVTLNWLQRKLPGQIPQSAHAKASFSCGYPDQKIECVSIPELALWTARFDHLDKPHKGQLPTAGRVWFMDISLLQTPESVEVGVRLFCSSQYYANTEIHYSRPRVVLELANAIGLKEILPLTGKALLVGADINVDNLVGLIKSTNRKLPVIALTQPYLEKEDVIVGEFVLDAEKMARELQGYAYVVKIPKIVSFELTSKIGKTWSVFNGATRTYMPGLDIKTDLPNAHPLALIDTVIHHRYKELMDEDAFEEFIIDKTRAYSGNKRVDWNGLLFVPDARTKALEIERQKLVSQIMSEVKGSNEEKRLLEDMIEKFRKASEEEKDSYERRIDELESQAEDYNNESMRATRDMDYYKEEAYKQKLVILMLRSQLEAKRDGKSIDGDLIIPADYDGLKNWVETNLNGRLSLHPRSHRGIDDAVYENPELVYRALLLLANEYRDLRMGIDGSRQKFIDELLKMGLEDRPSIARESANAFGDTYFIRWPIGTERKQFLDKHIVKGTSRDEKRCFRIYYFWDEENQEVIVGWLPSHLENYHT